MEGETLPKVFPTHVKGFGGFGNPNGSGFFRRRGGIEGITRHSQLFPQRIRQYIRVFIAGSRALQSLGKSTPGFGYVRRFRTASSTGIKAVCIAEKTTAVLNAHTSLPSLSCNKG